LAATGVSENIARSERDRELANLTPEETRLLLRILEKLSTSGDLYVFRQEISEDLLRLLKSDVIASYVWNEGTQAFGDFVGFGQNPLHAQEYVSYYQFHDPITFPLHKRKRATLVNQVMAQCDLEKTEFFNDFLMRDNQHHGVNLHAHEGEVDIGDLRIWRGEKRPEFGRRETALLDTILPHFRNALLNARALRTASGVEGFWTQLLDNMSVGLFLFDEAGRLLYLNEGARKVERELAPHEYSLFCDYVCSGVKDSRLRTGWGPFSLSVLRTISPRDSRPVTAVMVHPPVSKPIGAELLRSKYNLTPRETEICILVYKGLKDEEIADALGVAFTTVRTHLKRLFAKLDVTNRSELVYCLLEGLLDISF